MKHHKSVCLIIILLSFVLQTMAQKKSIDLEGHRGCRGLMPENSIPGFIKAVQIGVNTLEMDVVISQDKKVVVSHEPWINAEICLDMNGNKLNLPKENQLNIYQMTYEEISKYDCGSKHYERFPAQQKINTCKPLLIAVFDSVKSYCKKHSLSIPNLNIEIKSDTAYDFIFAPAPDEFCELVLKEVANNGMQTHCIIQSFDVRVLKYIHQKYPKVKLSFLSEEIRDFNRIIEALGFLPAIFSPDKVIVTKDLIAACHAANVEIIPWTVNDEQEIKTLLSWGVDGIISDFPDKIAKLF